MNIKKILYTLTGLPIAATLVLLLINWHVVSNGKPYIYATISDVPECYTGIVLGAKVNKSGSPSDILKDRIDVAIDLYKNHKIKRFLLTGDHGTSGYDEVNNMKDYLIKNGIDTENIFLDHAGFDTYSSMVRAKEVFQVTDAIIITQQFHLSRAVYIARSKGLNAYGVTSDKRYYRSMEYLKFREMIANVKALYEIIINKSPRFLGKQIPITGDSKLSYD
jgi:SanA protein